MNNDTRLCIDCQEVKPISEFYRRSGKPHLVESVCKSCKLERGKKPKGSVLVSTVASEELVINMLRLQGIPASPGKALSHKHVDVLAWGCVGLEIKFSTLTWQGFRFNATPKQMQRGFLAHLVVLVCDYGEYTTFHLFDVHDPVFYIEHNKYNPQTKDIDYTTTLKTSVCFVPGTEHPKKHSKNRVVMTQSMMDAAQDRWDLIEQWRVYLSDQLRNSA